jgi:F420-0:gamma-glutamyl ligase
MPDRQRPNVDGILLDKLRPKKQQHSAKRIFERLRDEYGLTGGITIGSADSSSPSAELVENGVGL